jgi:hypothetical protein
MSGRYKASPVAANVSGLPNRPSAPLEPPYSASFASRQPFLRRSKPVGTKRRADHGAVRSRKPSLLRVVGWRSGVHSRPVYRSAPRTEAERGCCLPTHTGPHRATTGATLQPRAGPIAAGQGRNTAGRGRRGTSLLGDGVAVPRRLALPTTSRPSSAPPIHDAPPMTRNVTGCRRGAQKAPCFTRVSNSERRRHPVCYAAPSPARRRALNYTPAVSTDSFSRERIRPPSRA